MLLDAGVALGAQPPTYLLPDPSRSANGRKVTAADWRGHRRAEVPELFRTHVCGQSPGRPAGLQCEIVEQDTAALNGKATRRAIDITVTGQRGSFTLLLTSCLPNSARRPLRLFLLLNPLRHGREPVNNPFFPVGEIVARGYAAAGITLGQLSPDNIKTYRQGTIDFYNRPAERSPDS